MENSSDEAEIIHPYAITKEHSNPLEFELHIYAQHTAFKLLDKGNYQYLIPVFSRQKNVQVIGIYQLKYKPETSITISEFR